jgi:hypothetical protein
MSMLQTNRKEMEEIIRKGEEACKTEIKERTQEKKQSRTGGSLRYILHTSELVSRLVDGCPQRYN